MKAILIRAATFACIFCAATGAHAEGQGWTGVWKIKSGPCPEGAVVTLTERPGVLTLQGKSGNEPYIHVYDDKRRPPHLQTYAGDKWANDLLAPPECS